MQASLIDCRQPKRDHILCNHLLAGLYLTLEKEPNEVEQNWKQLQVGRIISFQFYNYLMFEKVIVYVLRAICSVLKTITLRWHLPTFKRGGARLSKSVSSRWKLFARYPIYIVYAKKALFAKKNRIFWKIWSRDFSKLHPQNFFILQGYYN